MDIFIVFGVVMAFTLGYLAGHYRGSQETDDYYKLKGWRR